MQLVLKMRNARLPLGAPPGHRPRVSHRSAPGSSGNEPRWEDYPLAGPFIPSLSNGAGRMIRGLGGLGNWQNSAGIDVLKTIVKELGRGRTPAGIGNAAGAKAQGSDFHVNANAAWVHDRCCTTLAVQ